MSTAAMVAEWYVEAGAAHDGDWVQWWVQNHWDPGIEWRAIEGAPDDVGPMKGADRLARYYAEWIEIFDDIGSEVVTSEDVGDGVVLQIHVSAQSRSTGMPVELDYAVALELDGDRITRGREFATLEEARSAAAEAAQQSRL